VREPRSSRGRTGRPWLRARVIRNTLDHVDPLSLDGRPRDPNRNSSPGNGTRSKNTNTLKTTGEW